MTHYSLLMTHTWACRKVSPRRANTVSPRHFLCSRNRESSLFLLRLIIEFSLPVTAACSLPGDWHPLNSLLLQNRLHKLFCFSKNVSFENAIEKWRGEESSRGPLSLYCDSVHFKNLYNESLIQPISSQVHGQWRGCWWTWIVSLYLFSLLVPFERWWLVGWIGVPEWSGGLLIKSERGVLVVGCWKARDVCVGVAGQLLLTGTGRKPRSVRESFGPMSGPLLLLLLVDPDRFIGPGPDVEDDVPPPPYEPRCGWTEQGGAAACWAVGVGDLSSLIPHSFDFDEAPNWNKWAEHD